jgi:hypothetical protein
LCKSQVQLAGPLEKIASTYAAVQEFATEEDSNLQKCAAAVLDLQTFETMIYRKRAAGESIFHKTSIWPVFPFSSKAPDYIELGGLLRAIF